MLKDIIKLTPAERKVIGARFAQVRHARNLNQKEVAELFGWGEVGQGNVANLEAGKRSIGRQTLHLYATRLGTSDAFLLTGEGDMLSEATPKLPAKRTRGNLRVVRPEQRGLFCQSKGRNGFDWYVHPLLKGEYHGFVVGEGSTDVIDGKPLLADTMLLARLLPPDMPLQAGQLVVVREASRLVVGRLQNGADGLMIEAGNGPVPLVQDTRPRVYLITRLDVPVEAV